MPGAPLRVCFFYPIIIPMSEPFPKTVKVTDKLRAFKHKLRAGDIIVSKPSAKGSNLFSSTIAAISGSPWTHSGVYLGGGKIYHLYPTIKGKTVSGAHAMRTHSLSSLGRVDRDMFALRPNTTLKKKREAVKLLKQMNKLKYSVKDLLRAGFFPGKRKEEVSSTDFAICSGLIAMAYPDLDFRKGKEMRHVRPSDFVTSDAVKPVAGFDPTTKTAVYSAGYTSTLQNLGLL